DALDAHPRGDAAPVVAAGDAGAAGGIAHLALGAGGLAGALVGDAAAVAAHLPRRTGHADAAAVALAGVGVAALAGLAAGRVAAEVGHALALDAVAHLALPAVVPLDAAAADAAAVHAAVGRGAAHAGAGVEAGAGGRVA